MKNLADRIVRAQELLRTAHHIALATVNQDASPHNTPVFFATGPDLKHIYWSSHPDSQHSQNIQRTGQAFGVIYEADKGGGLYVRLTNGRPVTDDLSKALAVFNSRRKELGRQQVPSNHFANVPQELYMAEIAELWLNVSERNAHGFTVRDYRHEITAKELLAP